MKKVLIGILACLNIGLLLVLFFGVSPRKAEALEGSIVRNNYVMVSGRVGANEEAIYVVDLATQRMAAWRFDISRKRLVPLGTRNLRTDIPSRSSR